MDPPEEKQMFLLLCFPLRQWLRGGGITPGCSQRLELGGLSRSARWASGSSSELESRKGGRGDLARFASPARAPWGRSPLIAKLPHVGPDASSWMAPLVDPNPAQA